MSDALPNRVTLPHYGLHGSDPAKMAEEFVRVLGSLREAHTRLSACQYPNGRDFNIEHGDVILMTAKLEHRERITDLERMMVEMTQLAEHALDADAARSER